MRRDISVSTLNLPSRIAALLEAAGIRTLYDLNALMQRYDISKLPKMGREEAEIVRVTLDTFGCKDRK